MCVPFTPRLTVRRGLLDDPNSYEALALQFELLAQCSQTIRSRVHNFRVLPPDESLLTIQRTVSSSQLDALQQRASRGDAPIVYAEAVVKCDLTKARDRVRCLHPQLMQYTDDPALTYSVFEKWDGKSWHDYSDL